MLNVEGFDHERLEIFHDAQTGVTGAVAIHSTALGPAMGGLRLNAYESLSTAVQDALRLSGAMSLKNAAAGLALGGGKAVLVDDGHWDSAALRAQRMQAVGRVVRDLRGRYVTAEDVGTTPEDMRQIATETEWVAGRPVDRGGRGDPSPATAMTVFGAIRTAVTRAFDGRELAGVHVGVQGAGHVGGVLVGLLRQAGARVTVTDVDGRRAADVAAATGAEAVEAPGFLTRPFDVLAPCALGQVIDSAIVGRLRCKVVAGAANNQLTLAEVADDLARAGVLWVPDFIANCGGIIHVGAEPLGLSDAEVAELLDQAQRRTADVLDEATATGRTPAAVAVELAERRIAGAADAGAVWAKA